MSTATTGTQARMERDEEHSLNLCLLSLPMHKTLSEAVPIEIVCAHPCEAGQ
jgi:hypothetical protein